MFLGACGDDSSSTTDWGEEAYCVVKMSKSSVTQEVYEPGVAHGESGVSFKGDKTIVFLDETFLYDDSNRWRRECDGFDANEDFYDEGSYSCDSDGVKFTITTSSSMTSSLDQYADEMRAECKELSEKWKTDDYDDNRSSSRNSGYSSSSQSGESKIEKTEDVFEVKVSKKKLGNNAFTDTRDGNVYRVKEVGGHVWMLDNLRYGGTLDSPLKGEVSVHSDDDFENVMNRNAVVTYDFAAAVNVQGCNDKSCNKEDSLVRGVCPYGWTIPPKSEWEYLKTHLEDVDEFFGFPYTGEVSSGYWKNDGISRYWSSTEENDYGAWEFYFDGTNIKSQTYNKDMQYGIRCVAVKDVVLDSYENPPQPTSAASSESETSSSSAKVSSSSQVTSSSEDVDSSSSLASSSSTIDVEYEELVDLRDGKKYRFYTVGGLNWTVDNMRYESESMVHTWCMGLDGKLCDSGILYAFEEAGAACPEDWRLPTLEEWTVLKNGMESVQALMDTLNITPTGESNGSYTSMDDVARYWTSDSDGEGLDHGAYMVYVRTDSHEFSTQRYRKDYGYGVRCVQDVLTESP